MDKARAFHIYTSSTKGGGVMVIYYCQGCDKFVDDDESPMSELELCPDCEASREDDEDNPRRKTWPFTQ